MSIVVHPGSSQPATLESLLGPRRGRFFGEGYRRVEHHLTDCPEIIDEGTLFSACVAYPSDWSLNHEGKSRPAHLSTIDAVVLPLIALGRLGVVAPTDWVSRVDLRAGDEPWTQLDMVPVLIGAAETRGWGRREFRTLTGNIRASIEITSTWPPSVGRDEKDRIGIYEDLYRGTASETKLTGYDPDSCTLRAAHHFDQLEEGGEDRRLGGVEASYWPCVCIIDHLVAKGQLAQALIELQHGAGRVGTLWMRRVSLTLDRLPETLPSRFESSMSVVRDRVIGRPGSQYRDIAVESVTTTGVRVNALLAREETNR